MGFDWNKIKGVIKGDRVIWFVLMALSLFSLVIVYSATGKLAFNEAGGNTFTYLWKHFIKMFVGFLFILGIVNITPVRFYSKFANIILLVAIALLYVATLQHFIFHTPTNRSLDLGITSFQPAEIAKISLVIYVSKILATHREGNHVSRKGFRKVLIASALVLLPIALGDSSTALILALAIFAIMIIAGVKAKTLFFTVSSAVLTLAILILISPILPAKFGRIHTVRERIIDFAIGDEHEQQGTTQAQYSQLAIYEGGVTPLGKGVGNNDVSNYIEAAYSDFIFAIIIEEGGIVTAIIILLAYLIILFRGGAIAVRSKRSFPAFLVTGLVLMYTIQAFVNMMVATGLFPVTGQPLPFLSYGGTSIVFTSAAFGIVLAVSEETRKKPAPPSESQLIITDPDEDEEIKQEL
ncbi:MAG: FtsW/RodA/SpoVE family cell cycle protein [Mangrovibacterium sp.]